MTMTHVVSSLQLRTGAGLMSGRLCVEAIACNIRSSKEINFNC